MNAQTNKPKQKIPNEKECKVHLYIEANTKVNTNQIFPSRNQKTHSIPSTVNQRQGTKKKTPPTPRDFLRNNLIRQNHTLHTLARSSPNLNLSHQVGSVGLRVAFGGGNDGPMGIIDRYLWLGISIVAVRLKSSGPYKMKPSRSCLGGRNKIRFYLLLFLSYIGEKIIVIFVLFNLFINFIYSNYCNVSLIYRLGQFQLSSYHILIMYHN